MLLFTLGRKYIILFSSFGIFLGLPISTNFQRKLLLLLCGSFKVLHASASNRNSTFLRLSYIFFLTYNSKMLDEYITKCMGIKYDSYCSKLHIWVKVVTSYLFGFGEVKVFFKRLMVSTINWEILGICSESFVMNFWKDCPYLPLKLENISELSIWTSLNIISS